MTDIVAEALGALVREIEPIVVAEMATFRRAMADAEGCVHRLRALGLTVEIRHPMQARQTMDDTLLSA